MTVSMSSFVMPTAYRASSCSISTMSLSGMRLSSVLVHDMHRRTVRHRLAGQHIAIGDLILAQRVVDMHRCAARDELGHAGRTVAGFAGVGRLQAHLPRGLQDRGAWTVVRCLRLAVDLNGALHRAGVGERGRRN